MRKPGAFAVEVRCHRGVSRPRLDQYHLDLAACKTVLQALGVATNQSFGSLS